jgi:hypothetical protein
VRDVFCAELDPDEIVLEDFDAQRRECVPAGGHGKRPDRRLLVLQSGTTGREQQHEQDASSVAQALHRLFPIV